MQVTREGLGEALTGGRIGQPLSRERDLTLGADAVLYVEDNTEGRVKRECPEDPAWSETLACAYASCADPGDLTVGQQPSCVLLWSVSEGEEP